MIAEAKSISQQNKVSTGKNIDRIQLLPAKPVVVFKPESAHFGDY